MLQNSLNSNQTIRPKRRWSALFLFPSWVFFSFLVSSLFLSLLLSVFSNYIGSLNQSIVNLAITVSVYSITIIVVMTVPLLFKKRPVTWELLGLTRLPTFKDIGLAIIGFVIYLILSVIVMTLVKWLIPIIDLNQVQDVGFSALSSRYEYMLAFLALVVIAPIAEEVLFRGYLYGKLRQYVPIWASVIVTSLLFALVHLQWNVAIDVFVLSVILCLLREKTGSISSSIIVHMIKNAIAFYFYLLIKHF